jgi:hypothetical protein
MYHPSDAAIKALIYGSADPWTIRPEGLQTRYVQGEFLYELNRQAQSTPQIRS